MHSRLLLSCQVEIVLTACVGTQYVYCASMLYRNTISNNKCRHTKVESNKAERRVLLLFY